MRTNRRGIAAVLAVLAVLAILIVAVGVAAGGSAAARAPASTVSGPDINGDGYADLVVGAPGEEIRDAIGAGAITVQFGGASGMATSGGQSIHQDTPGIPGASERHDGFGSRLAFADFDGDGYDDIVVASPGEGLRNATRAGMVTIIPGSRSGAKASRAVALHQGTAGMPGGSETGDEWGLALATGDFDGDGYGDLAVGAPFEDRGAVDVGTVTVLYGSSTGLRTQRARLISQASRGVPSAPEPSDEWGSALAAGDVNGDGFDDVVVGVPRESLRLRTDAGALTVLFGSVGGLRSRGARYLSQSSPDMPGGSENGDAWAEALAVGDFDGDGFADIAVGAPSEGVGRKRIVGTVTVVPGSATGPDPARASLWSQASPGVRGGNEANDAWGLVLVAGDFDGDGRDDLAVGAPFEAVGSVLQAGAVTVLLGSPTGIRGAGSKQLVPGHRGVPGTPEAGDHFADALAALDLDGDGRVDLAVATSAESLGSDFDTGALVVLYGAASGPETGRALFLYQEHPSVPGTDHTGDYWGALGAATRLGLQRPPLGLRTTTGVNVTVLGALLDESGYIVRTPCGRAVPLTSGTTFEDIEVVIDPGHGGRQDVGAVAHGIIERDLNLSIALPLVEELERRGIRATSTRIRNDYLVPLAVRGSYADQLQADLMVSIHHNAPTSALSRRPGSESYYQSNSPDSRRLGGLVYASVFDKLSTFNNVSWVSRTAAGAMRVLLTKGTDAYGMMSRPRTPTTLVELTYLGNPSEAALIKSSAYVPAMVDALADSIETYLDTDIPGSGYQPHRVFNPAFAPGLDVCRDPDLGK